MLDSLCLTDLVHRETTITDNRWFVPGDVCSIHADRIAFFGFRLKTMAYARNIETQLVRLAQISD